MENIVSLIGTVGFPIAACLLMGFFIWKIYQNSTKQNEENMSKVQARCAEREDILYKRLEKQDEQIAKTQEINAKAVTTLALYSERLGVVEQDVKEIKTSVTKIEEKLS